jgi:hypothetical protein
MYERVGEGEGLDHHSICTMHACVLHPEPLLRPPTPTRVIPFLPLLLHLTAIACNATCNKAARFRCASLPVVFLPPPFTHLTPHRDFEREGHGRRARRVGKEVSDANAPLRQRCGRQAAPEIDHARALLRACKTCLILLLRACVLAAGARQQTQTQHLRRIQRLAHEPAQAQSRRQQVRKHWRARMEHRKQKRRASVSKRREQAARRARRQSTCASRERPRASADHARPGRHHRGCRGR